MLRRRETGGGLLIRSMDLPKRKRNRLENWDYSTNGAYFVTICTYNRETILGRDVGAIHESPATGIALTQIGKIVSDTAETLPQRFPEIKLEKYVVMPNHVHLLLLIDRDPRAIRESPLQSGRSLISKVVGYFKMNSSKKAHKIEPGLMLWQRSFHDHIIRNDVDYLRIWEYIDTNPIKWREDCFFKL